MYELNHSFTLDRWQAVGPDHGFDKGDSAARNKKTAAVPNGTAAVNFLNLQPMQRWESLGERRGSDVLSTSHYMILAYPKKWSLSRMSWRKKSLINKNPNGTLKSIDHVSQRLEDQCKSRYS